MVRRLVAPMSLVSLALGLWLLAGCSQDTRTNPWDLQCEPFCGDAGVDAADTTDADRPPPREVGAEVGPKDATETDVPPTGCDGDCPGRQVCRDGACRCPGELSPCGDVCVDLSSDPDHCGRCGRSCPAGCSSQECWKWQKAAGTGNYTCGLRGDGAIQCWGGIIEYEDRVHPGDYQDLAVGTYHHCGLTDAGAVKCWGGISSEIEAAEIESDLDGTYRAIDAFHTRTCAVLEDATLECVGPDGSYTSRRADGRFKSVSVGHKHLCGLRKNGSVGCSWFDGASAGPSRRFDFGQTAEPKLQFQRLAAGAYHTCGVTMSGRVECWGLGVDSKRDEAKNVREARDFDQAAPPKGRFRDVDAGAYHTCAIAMGGRVECWGLGSERGSHEGGSDRNQAVPPDTRFANIHAAPLHSCGVTIDGTLECWGTDRNGQSTPPGGVFTQVAVSRRHVCALRRSGRVRCFGTGSSPDVADEGLYDFDQAAPPTTRFAGLTVSTMFSCGLTDSGRPECWGLGSRPGVDEGSDDPELDFDQASPPDGRFDVLQAGRFHACGLRPDGRVECWGLGSRAGVDEGKFDFDQAIAPDGRFRDLSVGAYHACGVTPGGSTECWGLGSRPGTEDGQREFGSRFDRDQAVPKDGDFSSVSAGADHSCGIRPTGRVTCWGGAPFHGPLSPPAQDFRMLSSGQGHTCGITRDGRLECWGGGTRVPETHPEGRFRAVSVAGTFACAITPSGGLRCWENKVR